MATNPTGLKALAAAIEMLGGQNKAAPFLGTLQQNISKVINGRIKTIPPEWAPRIEIATGGKITRKMIRPDLYE